MRAPEFQQVFERAAPLFPSHHAVCGDNTPYIIFYILGDAFIISKIPYIRIAVKY